MLEAKELDIAREERAGGVFVLSAEGEHALLENRRVARIQLLVGIAVEIVELLTRREYALARYDFLFRIVRHRRLVTVSAIQVRTRDSHRRVSR